jgi:tetratricopeptide (TPR) repeat protein
MKGPRVKRILLCLLFAAAPCMIKGDSGPAPNDSKEIPWTTNSEDARRAFRGGLENLENQQTHRAHNDFRSAVRSDSKFALAHLFLAYDNGDPSEEKAELEKAQALAGNASKPEQMMVEWMAGSRQGRMVPAIAAMNDLLAAYPDDKVLLFLAGRWMVQQKNYEPAQKFLERAIAIDPNYPAALNELGYGYAGTHDFDRAFASLDRYVQLLPGEPNTEDSYGEISRKAGRFEQAIEHYNKALGYDSTFVWSQGGLADTYMLMGKEERARAEYAKAIAAATSVGDRLDWELQSALTYFYEKQHENADAALTKVAQEAHSLHVGKAEATSYRIMSEYDPDIAGILHHSQDAEEALTEKTDISGKDRDEEMSQVLEARAVQAASFGKMDIANASLQKLAAMAATSRDSVVLTANEGAIGGVLWAQKKFSEAIPHLEEDQANPLSSARLAMAYRETGDLKRADEVIANLNSDHEPTIEDFLARQMLSGRGNKSARTEHHGIKSAD